MTNIGTVYMELLAESGTFAASVQKEAGKAGTAGATTLNQKMVAGVKGFASTASVVGGAAGTMMASAIEGAETFEDQLRTINTVAKLTDPELQAIGDSIQGLSVETGKSTDDLTAGFYDLVSAGVPADKAINVLRDSAIFATGALGTTAESVDLVTSVMNAYGLQAEDSAHITDVFAKAVQDGKVTAAELGQSIANVAPIAAQAGISMEELSAGYALLTAKGVPAAQASTQMRAAISALLTPNETLNKLQAQTGKNYLELAKTEGLSASLEQMRQDFQANGDALAKLAGVGEQEFPAALKTMAGELGLTSAQVAKFTKLAGTDGAVMAINEVAKATGKSDEGFAKALGSVEAYGFSLATTGENAEAMGQQIDETLATSGLALEQYTEKSKSSVEQSKRFSNQIKVLTQDFGSMFGAIAPLLLTVNQLGPAFGNIITPAKLAGGAIGSVLGRAVTKIPGARLLGNTGVKIAGGIAGGILSAKRGIGFAVSTAATGATAGLETAGKKVAGGIAKGILSSKAVVGGAISSAVAGITSSSLFTGAMSKIVTAFGVTGTQAGLAFSAAATAAILAFPVIITWVMEQWNNEKSRERTNEISEAVRQIITEGSTDGMEKARKELEVALKIEQGQHEGLAGFFHGIFGASDETAQLQGDLDALTAALSQGGEDAGSAFQDSFDRTASEQPLTGSMQVIAQRLGAALGPALSQPLDEAATVAAGKAKEIGRVIPESIGQAVMERRNVVADSLSSLKDLMQNLLGRSQVIARDIGILTSKTMAEGLSDGRAAVRIEARRVQAQAEAELALLIGRGGKVGEKAMTELNKGLKSKNPEIRASMKRVKAIVEAGAQTAVPAAHQKGIDTGNAFADGAQTALDRRTLTIGFTVGGKNVAHKDDGRAIGGATLGGRPYWVNENTARSELFVPGPGRVLTHSQALSALQGAGGGGGDSFTIPINVTGVLKAETPADLARPMRELVNTGVIRSRRHRSRIEVPTRA